MAKGNLFLGTAARSVGDVVMYRREGSQVSRVRVRKVANPRTDAQSLQRAAFSPVAKFFSPLAVVLERAFEGVSKSRSYSEFLKVNIKKARENEWLLPKGTGFFPLPYQLTKGSLQAFNVTYGATNHELVLNDMQGAGPGTTIGVLSTALVASGYNAGDVVTFILIYKDSANNYYPNTYQFEIDTTSTATISDTLGGLSMMAGNSSFGFTNENRDIQGGAICIARFENDKWRRSTQALVVDPAIIENISSAEFKAAAVASYGNTAGDINPMVYLDGSELEG